MTENFTIGTLQGQDVCDLLNSILDRNAELEKENEELKQVCKTLIKYIEENSITFIIDPDIRRLLE